MVAHRLPKRDQGLRCMKSIERKADGEHIGGLSADAESEVRVDPHSIRGAMVEACAVGSTGEATLRGESMTPSETCTVYFDGACPVCRREIAHYRQQRGSESIAWVDASSCNEAELGPGLDRSLVLSRFHVRNADGTLTSGAAAFVVIWRRLPAFSWLAALASSRPVLAVLEGAYSIFLRIRPWWRAVEVPINAAPMHLSGGGMDRPAGRAEPPARSVVRVVSTPEESQ